MTRPEITGKRSLAFSKWIKDKLPDSETGYLVYNLDFILWHKDERKLILIEEKTRFGELAQAFRMLMINVIAPALRNYAKENEIDFRGFMLIQFENTCPSDGKIYLNDKEISEEELIKILSME